MDSCGKERDKSFTSHCHHNVGIFISESDVGLLCVVGRDKLEMEVRELSKEIGDSDSDE